MCVCVQLALKAQIKYVARVRSLGTAKDGKTKLRSEWTACSETFELAKRMGGGFGLVQSVEVQNAMAKARRRASERVRNASTSERGSDTDRTSRRLSADSTRRPSSDESQASMP
jgi:hypothetical protein